MNTSIYERGRKIIATTLVIVMMAPFLSPVAFGLTSGPNVSTSESNDASNTGGSVGTKTWTNLGNVHTSNNQYTSIAGGSGLNSGEISQNIKMTGFGFAIPVGATIQGISVSVERKQQDS